MSKFSQSDFLNAVNPHPVLDQGSAMELIIWFCRERDGRFLLCCCLGASRNRDLQGFFFTCRGRKNDPFIKILCLPGGLNSIQAANMFAVLISERSLSMKGNL